MISLSAMRRPHAVICSIGPMVGGAGRGGQAAARRPDHTGDPTGDGGGAVRRPQHSLLFTADGDQVIPSITAVMAAPRTAAVATMSVTAAANHRRAPSRGAARGKVQGIAGSMRIVDAPTQALGHRNIRATGSNNSRLKPVASESGCAKTQ